MGRDPPQCPLPALWPTVPFKEQGEVEKDPERWGPVLGTSNRCEWRLWRWLGASSGKADIHIKGILLAMALDRYVAICNPLRHATIFTHQLLTKIGVGVTLRGALLVAPCLILIKCRLKYYWTTVVSHSYCEHMAIVKLAAEDIRINKIYAVVVPWLVVQAAGTTAAPQMRSSACGCCSLDRGELLEWLLLFGWVWAAYVAAVPEMQAGCS
ncbi:hypothetical protein QTO34_003831 [Cnephaeus nilssonii]|uniref:G-protein coupled receptors family 1 profile domain-containing protein n=1 Tax=Cnephaeus nilssonii TaxID=3371016 RepID=A0AA40LJS6_CNENI|nr:hypothetical protein QTO34_003831 [Eptesicus nilssonii]